MLSGGCAAPGRYTRRCAGWPSVEHGLASLATLRAGAAYRDHRTGAGMEIGTEGWNHSGASVDLSCRINLEGIILLNNPLVIGHRNRRSLRIHDRHLHTAPCKEIYRDSRGIAFGSL